MSRLSERECRHCGETFKPNRPKQKFCTSACYRSSPQMGRKSRNESWRRCKGCDRDFFGIRRTQVFCSPECRRKHHNKTSFTCPTCGRTQLVWRHRGRRHCSRKCRWGEQAEKRPGGDKDRLTQVRPRKKSCVHAFDCGPTELVKDVEDGVIFHITEGRCTKCSGFARFVMREELKRAPVVVPAGALEERPPVNEIPYYL